MPGIATREDFGSSFPGTFLREPNNEEVAHGIEPLVRFTSGLTIEKERFRVDNRMSGEQYAMLYFIRLKLMIKNGLKQAALDRWGSELDTVKISKVSETSKCIVIGTVYKQMEKKPSVLDEFADGKAKALAEANAKEPKHVSVETDHLILEDESGRCTLSGNVPVGEVVTGIVMAAKGEEDDEGYFHVEDYCFVGVPSRDGEDESAMAVDSSAVVDEDDFEADDHDDDPLLCLISGIEVNGRNDLNGLAYQAFHEWLSGYLGGEKSTKLASRVCRVAILGNLFHRDGDFKPNYLFGENRGKRLPPIDDLKDCDTILQEMVSQCPVLVIPGANDPSGFNMPQQPIHWCLFPKTARFNSFSSGPNPTLCTITQEENEKKSQGANGVAKQVTALFTSGQTVDDIYKYVETDDRLEIACNTLKWGHIAPTMPDTLQSYPYQKDDPFILDTLPHLYCVGNQSEYGSRLVKNSRDQACRVIMVPRFAITGTAVLVNLRTLKSRSMTFFQSVGERE
eukprot:Clim_evm9s228 gene=Clim_evmTU9s228